MAARDRPQRLSGANGLNAYATLTPILTDFPIDPCGGEHDFRRKGDGGGGRYTQIRADRQAPLGQAVQVANDIYGRVEVMRYRHDGIALNNRVVRQPHALLLGELG